MNRAIVEVGGEAVIGSRQWRVTVSLVTIRFMGPIRRPSGMGATAEVEVDEASTIDGLLEQLGYDAADRSRLRVMQGGRTLGASEPVGQAEELTVFLPLGGG